jgi:para-aminobenzoate synthetase component 1
LKNKISYTGDEKQEFNVFHPFFVTDAAAFKTRALAWADSFEVTCYLDHNDYPHTLYHDYDCLIGVTSQPVFVRSQQGDTDAFEALKTFHEASPGWLFGFLGYDLKNQVEKLGSDNPDGIGLPDMYFFRPDYVVALSGNEVRIYAGQQEAATVFSAINCQQPLPGKNPLLTPEKIQHRISKKTYIETVQAIREHIRQGDVYEMNFCQEFYTSVDMPYPVSLFDQLNRAARAPFSAYFKLNDRYLLCASPERFLKKTGNKVISQPIKGTLRRGSDAPEDEVLKKMLRESIKDRAEHVMIVDLVRNDLARSCRAGTVQVEELFGIYPFRNVLQMISTIAGELRPGIHWTDAIRNAFPMGSMTGAPKIKAMELIENYEQTKRGLYSGSVGYITPEGDFDLNVVIRSMIYNAADRYLSFQAGGAIVYDSDPEAEYEECLLKSDTIRGVLGGG